MITVEFLEGLGMQNLKPAGIEIRGRCPVADTSPFHSRGDRRPSWSINTETGLSFCATCDKGWSLFSLLQMLALDPKKARALLEAAKQADHLAKAGRAGSGRVKTYSVVKGGGGKPKHDRSLDIVFAQWWDHLLDAPYMKKRGYPASFLRKNKVGYDPKRKRVVVPIYEEGVLIGAVGRATKPTQKLRYYFYHQLKKGQHLYIPRHTVRPYRYLDTIFVVEGVLDALRLAQLGCPWVICVFGTKVTRRQADVIARLACENEFTVTLFMDDDPPGHRATGSLGSMLRGRIPGIEPNVIIYPEEVSDPGELEPEERKPLESVTYLQWLDTRAMLDVFSERYKTL